MTAQEPPHRHEPMFNVPGVVLAVIVLFAAVHAARHLLPDDKNQWWTLALAFIPLRYAGHAQELPGGTMASITSFLTHMVVHGDRVHLLVNTGWMLAFGGAVAQRTGALLFLAFALVCGFAGAGLFLLLNQGLAEPMVGASGAISGLVAATFRFLFSAIDTGGLWQLRLDPRAVPLMSLAEAVRDRRIMVIAATWIAINFLAIIGIGNLGSEGGIAWEAHIGGFIAGFLLFGVFDPVARAQALRSAARPTGE